MTIVFLLSIVGCGKKETASEPPTPEPIVETVTETLPVEEDWKTPHRELLEKIRNKNPDLKFSLLYVDGDDIPEICVYAQSEGKFDIFCYDSFYGFTRHFVSISESTYYYDFYYRPHEKMFATYDGSLANGTAGLRVYDCSSDSTILTYYYPDVTSNASYESWVSKEDETRMASLDIHKTEEKQGERIHILAKAGSGVILTISPSTN
jgi:hypothetical protein